MLELTEEEQIIINQNGIISDKSLIDKEKGFTQLLNTYLLKDTFNEEHLEIENVPGCWRSGPLVSTSTYLSIDTMHNITHNVYRFTFIIASLFITYTLDILTV